MYPEITYTSLIIRKSPTLDYASPLNDIKGWIGILGIKNVLKIKIKSCRPRHIFLHFRMINSCFFFTGLSPLNPRKETGPNSIPSDILHILKKDISHHLSIIFNISFSTGVHPDLLKIAKTIPIYKKGSKLNTGNYRPISLLSNLNKILEKLMFSRVHKFLEDH